MHGAARLFPVLFAGSDREKIRSAAAASAGVRTRVRTHNGFGIPPGESGRVTLTADRRLLARFDGTAGQWRINQGGYHVVVARAPMTHTSRRPEAGRSTLRHLTFASYGSPEPAIALFVSRCSGFLGRGCDATGPSWSAMWSGSWPQCSFQSPLTPAKP